MKPSKSQNRGRQIHVIETGEIVSHEEVVRGLIKKTATVACASRVDTTIEDASLHYLAWGILEDEARARRLQGPATTPADVYPMLRAPLPYAPEDPTDAHHTFHRAIMARRDPEEPDWEERARRAIPPPGPGSEDLTLVPMAYVDGTDPGIGARR